MTYKDFPVRLVDVSAYQDNPGTVKKPNLDKFVEEGFLGVGVRCAYGIVEDKMYKDFWASAKGRMARLNYLYGDYYSWQYKKIKQDEWGVMQGANWHELTKADPGEIPPHLDCEESTYGFKYSYLNIANVTKVYRNTMTEYHRLSGYWPDIYTVPGHLWIFGDWFKDFPLWLAWYDRTKTLEQLLAAVKKYGWRGPVNIWQYASDGDMNDDGIADGLPMGLETKNFDLNVFVRNGGSLEEWSKFCGGTQPAQPTESSEDESATPQTTNANHPTKTIETYQVKCADGLNIRDYAGKPSNIIGWLKDGSAVDVLEKIVSGQDTWARVGCGQYCAIRYNGIDYMI